MGVVQSVGSRGPSTVPRFLAKSTFCCSLSTSACKASATGFGTHSGAYHFAMPTDPFESLCHLKRQHNLYGPGSKVDPTCWRSRSTSPCNACATGSGTHPGDNATDTGDTSCCCCCPAEYRCCRCQSTPPPAPLLLAGRISPGEGAAPWPGDQAAGNLAGTPCCWCCHCCCCCCSGVHRAACWLSRKRPGELPGDSKPMPPGEPVLLLCITAASAE